LWSFIRVVGACCLIVLLPAMGRGGDGFRNMDARQLAAGLDALEGRAGKEDASAQELLGLARQAREIQQQADVSSPDTMSTLSKRAGGSTMRFASLAVRSVVRTSPGDRTRVHSAGHMDSLNEVWSFTANYVLSLLERWPQYWNTPIEETRMEEIWLPALLVSWCRTDELGGDDWEMGRIANPRIATLPESVATCCLGPTACNHLWKVDCRQGLLAEMARSPERDSLVEYRFAAEFWNAVGNHERFSEYDILMAASRTIAFFGHMVGVARDRDLDGVPGKRIPEPVALDLMKGAKSLWPPDSNPFQTLPGLRNPRIGMDNRIMCDLLIDPTCADFVTQEMRHDFEYLAGGGIIVR